MPKKERDGIRHQDQDQGQEQVPQQYYDILEGIIDKYFEVFGKKAAFHPYLVGTDDSFEQLRNELEELKNTHSLPPRWMQTFDMQERYKQRGGGQIEEAKKQLPVISNLIEQYGSEMKLGDISDIINDQLQKDV